MNISNDRNILTNLGYEFIVRSDIGYRYGSTGYQQVLRATVRPIESTKQELLVYIYYT